MGSKYKTLVVDYEAMQACLDQHAEQGWKLQSVTPDSWRRVISVNGAGGEPAVREASENGAPEEEIVASYYLLVFVRDDEVWNDHGLASAVEELPEKGFSLPEF